jgi:hypothetical protein
VVIGIEVSALRVSKATENPNIPLAMFQAIFESFTKTPTKSRGTFGIEHPRR